MFEVFLSGLFAQPAFDKLEQNGYSVTKADAKWLVCLDLSDNQQLVAYQISKLFAGAPPTLHIKNGREVSEGVCNRDTVEEIVVTLSQSSTAENLSEAIKYMKKVLGEFES